MKELTEHQIASKNTIRTKVLISGGNCVTQIWKDGVIVDVVPTMPQDCRIHDESLLYRVGKADRFELEKKSKSQVATQYDSLED